MNNNDIVYVTEDGLKKLKEELKELIEVKRPDISMRIKEARDMGDLSENELYHSVKQEQAFTEGRINELEEIIKNAQVAADPKKGSDMVTLGSKVRVHIDGDEEIFHIVGGPEADPMNKKISAESPLGAAMLGKKLGEKFEVEAPVGTLIYKVISIE